MVVRCYQLSYVEMIYDSWYHGNCNEVCKSIFVRKWIDDHTQLGIQSNQLDDGTHQKSFQHVKKNAGRNRWILKNQWNIVGIY